MQASEEQLLVLRHVKEGSNVIVDAIAGSGKSTTILTIATAMPEKRFLQITYNSMLRKEFRDKIVGLGITNIEIHTYHSFAVKYYSGNAFTDTGIRQILCTDKANDVGIPQYDIVVIDECQDMTHLYYTFIRRVLDGMKDGSIQLLILGDYMQGLYEFKGADIRFLTQASKIWTGHPFLKSQNDFVALTLGTSYRITNQMASFMNRAMLGEERLHACRDGEPVIYIRNTHSNMEKIVIYHIRQLLAEGDLPRDIFILGSSVKGPQSLIRKMENALVESNIPCHVPMMDVEGIDERVAEGKIVFSTFHAVKGRQRKHVFVLGFDNSYFSMYGRNLARNECPSTLYVACTRATHKMWLLERDQWQGDRPLKCMKMTHHDMKNSSFVDFKGNPQTLFFDQDTNSNAKVKTKMITATDLIRFIPESVLEEITPLLMKIFVLKEKGLDMNDDMPSVVHFNSGLYEDVSDLNGIAIPCMYYDYLYKKRNNESGSYTSNVLYGLIESSISALKPDEHIYLKQVFRTLDPECTSVNDYLYMANVYTAFQERLYFKLKQIERTEYTWLTEECVSNCIQSLDNVIPETGNCIAEETIISYDMETEHIAIDSLLERELGSNLRYRFCARIDLISEDTIYELKCTSQVSVDHMLQLVIYAWLWSMVPHPNRTSEIKHFKLYNLKTQQLWELVATVEELTTIVVALLRGKYGELTRLTDEQFVESCR